MPPYYSGTHRGHHHPAPGDSIPAPDSSANMPDTLTHNPKVSVVYYHQRDADDTNMGRYHKVTCRECGSMWTHIPGRGVALYVLRYHTLYPDVENIPWPPTMTNLISRTMRTVHEVGSIPRKNWTKRLRRS